MMQAISKDTGAALFPRNNSAFARSFRISNHSLFPCNSLESFELKRYGKTGILLA
ncbi:hypothetical protein HUU39_08565 [candidate division KSB1 bacterium]|nr:hypothetical protein [bacterium]NUM65321.1 hypothetical protein [candidate division KSB1 bacterium]